MSEKTLFEFIKILIALVPMTLGLWLLDFDMKHFWAIALLIWANNIATIKYDSAAEKGEGVNERD